MISLLQNYRIHLQHIDDKINITNKLNVSCFKDVIHFP